MKQNVAEKRWLALVAVSLASFVGFIDVAIVNTVLPGIQHSFSATLVELQWVTNITALVLCVFLVSMGRLADIHGRRLLLNIGLILIGIASLGAGLASSIYWLIAFRAIQAMGMAMIFPASLAIIYDVFPKHEQGRAVGIWSSIASTGMFLGPVLGGILMTILSWRWVFFLNIPFVIIGLLLCAQSVRESRISEGKARMDWPGFILLTVGVAALVFGILQGPEVGWNSVIIIAAFIIAVISLLFFAIVETQVPSPIVRFSLFANRTFLAYSIANATIICFYYTLLFFLPLYLYNIRGELPYMVGIMLLPVTATVILFSPFVGKLCDTVGGKQIILVGFFLFAIAMLMFAFFEGVSPLWLVILTFIIYGLGWGISFSPLKSEPIAILPARLAGTASGVLTTIDSLGGAVGFAIAGVIFRHHIETSLTNKLGLSHIVMTPQVHRLVKCLCADPSQGVQILERVTPGISHQLMPLFRSAFMYGFRGVMWFLFLITVITFFLILFVVKPKEA